MSNIILRVDILPGTMIDVACNELCCLAAKLDVCVETKVNSISLFVTPTSNPALLATNFADALKDGGNKVVSA